VSVLLRLSGDRELLAWMRGLPYQVRTAVRRKMDAEMSALVEAIRGKLSGQVLESKSGRLRRSIVARISSQQGRDTLVVGSEGVPYARIHEYGGVVRIPEIRPRRADALHFLGSAKDFVFAARTRSHTVTIPERSYLRSTVADRIVALRESLQEAAREASARP
jgi:phage gpG-like protein